MNQNFAAIILGGTGQVGGAAVAELLAIPECREICRPREIRGHDVCCRSTKGVEGEMKSVL
jgi:hypothetical protein